MGRREQRRVKQSLQQTAQRTVCLDVEVVEPGPQLWVVGNSHLSCLGFSLYIHRGLLVKLTTFRLSPESQEFWEVAPWTSVPGRQD